MNKKYIIKNSLENVYKKESQQLSFPIKKFVFFFELFFTKLKYCPKSLIIFNSLITLLGKENFALIIGLMKNTKFSYFLLFSFKFSKSFFSILIMFMFQYIKVKWNVIIRATVFFSYIYNAWVSIYLNKINKIWDH